MNADAATMCAVSNQRGAVLRGERLAKRGGGLGRRLVAALDGDVVVVLDDGHALCDGLLRDVQQGDLPSAQHPAPSAQHPAPTQDAPRHNTSQALRRACHCRANKRGLALVLVLVLVVGLEPKRPSHVHGTLRLHSAAALTLMPASAHDMAMPPPMRPPPTIPMLLSLTGAARSPGTLHHEQHPTRPPV